MRVTAKATIVGYIQENENVYPICDIRLDDTTIRRVQSKIVCEPILDPGTHIIVTYDDSDIEHFSILNKNRTNLYIVIIVIIICTIFIAYSYKYGIRVDSVKVPVVPIVTKGG